MSYSSICDINFFAGGRNGLEILHILLDNGWSYNDHGNIMYLPPGDNDMFNWRRVNLDLWPDVLEILREKTKMEEPLGLVLTWKNTAIGGDFYLASVKPKNLSIGWSINRKTMEGDFTDHSWYIAKVIVPLSVNGIKIESFRCFDSI